MNDAPSPSDEHGMMQQSKLLTRSRLIVLKDLTMNGLIGDESIFLIGDAARR